MSARRDGAGLANVALWVAILATLIIAAGAVVARVGVGSYALGHDLISVQIGRVAAVIALLLALIALTRSLGNFKNGGVLALGATLIAVLLVGGEAHYMLKTRNAAPVHDVSTNWEDPVDLSDVLLNLRRGADNAVENDPHVPASAGAPWAGKRVAEVNAQTCPRAKAIMHGVDADRAAQVLQDNDVQVLGSQVFRVEGVYTGFWFGAKDDVVVRIRPERTDVRSIRRFGVSDDGSNCKLVTRIAEALDHQSSVAQSASK